MALAFLTQAYLLKEIENFLYQVRRASGNWIAKTIRDYSIATNLIIPWFYFDSLKLFLRYEFHIKIYDIYIKLLS